MTRPVSMSLILLQKNFKLQSHFAYRWLHYIHLYYIYRLNCFFFLDMDGGSNSDVNAVIEDVTTEFATIPLLLEFDVPETVVPINVENNAPVEMEQEPQQEPVTVFSAPSVVTAIPTVTAVRLDSGADDNLSTAVADVESENIDQCDHRDRSRGRSRRSRSRSRSRRSRSRSDDSDFSVHIAEDKIPDELVASTSCGGQKATCGIRRVRKVALARGRRGGKDTRGSRVSDKLIRGRKSTRGRKGRKTSKSAPARSTWSGRLRSNNTNKRSKAK